MSSKIRQLKMSQKVKSYVDNC